MEVLILRTKVKSPVLSIGMNKVIGLLFTTFLCLQDEQALEGNANTVSRSLELFCPLML